MNEMSLVPAEEPQLKEALLKANERWLAGLASGALFVAALVVLFRPPTRTTESGVVRDGVRQATEYSTAVPDVAPVLSVLFAVAAVLVLVAVLGRRFTKIMLPGIEIESEGDVEELQADEDSGEAPEGAAGEPVGGQRALNILGGPDGHLSVRSGEPPNPQAWERLDGWARRALIGWANGGQEVLTSPVSCAVTDARRLSPSESDAWFVSVRIDDGSVRVFRVAPKRVRAAITSGH